MESQPPLAALCLLAVLGECPGHPPGSPGSGCREEVPVRPWV